MYSALIEGVLQAARSDETGAPPLHHAPSPRRTFLDEAARPLLRFLRPELSEIPAGGTTLWSTFEEYSSANVQSIARYFGVRRPWGANKTSLLRGSDDELLRYGNKRCCDEFSQSVYRKWVAGGFLSRNYQPLLRRLSAFEIVYAAPNAGKFHRAEALFTSLFAPTPGVNTQHLCQYFTVRQLWESGQTSQLTRTDRELLRDGDQRCQGQISDHASPGAVVQKALRGTGQHPRELRFGATKDGL